MRKKDLFEFIEQKIKAERKKLAEAVREEITARLEPIIEDLFTQMELVEARAKNLSESYLKALEAFGLENSWDETSIVRDLRSRLFSWSRYKRNDIRNTVHNAVMNPHSDAYKTMLNLKKFRPEIVELTEILIKEYEPKRKKLLDFNVLQKELENVVTIAPSAKKAYHQLKDLGVDMSGFKEAEETLPAVVKLSVDPCLINGGCA